MKKSDFYFFLPPELIAQTPIEPRDRSRLLKMNRLTGELEHRHFYDIPEYFDRGDVLVLNDTKVLPARLYGSRYPDGAIVEFLLLHTSGNDTWECITGPGKKAKAGGKFSFGGGVMNAEVLEVLENGNRLVHFGFDGNFYETLDKIGEMPLPHYITEKLKDKNRYQTVYAKEPGSAAAPTAGLHFTPELLKRIKDKGVTVVYITLHVGIGTFRPVKTENIEEHIMHSEHYFISPETASVINEAKIAKKKIFAVGTTCCRTLESASDENGHITSGDAWTNIFIYPGYDFKCVDALITNFHLPESSLIMLVSAFCGLENTRNAYETAVEEKYRFFSFGDANLIL